MEPTTLQPERNGKESSQEPVIDKQLAVDVWKKVVDVQMHFNDLCLRLRSVAITVLGTLLGAAAAAFKFGGTIKIINHEEPTAVIFFIISLIVWMAFFWIDRYWYHELLKGAVHHGQKIEERFKAEMPEISLALEIRDQSHQSFGMNAAKKLNIFYWGIFLIQLIGLVLVFLVDETALS
jgi:hypothetical protein